MSFFSVTRFHLAQQDAVIVQGLAGVLTEFFQQVVHGKAQIEQSGLVDHAVPDDDARAAGDQLCSAAGPHTQRGQEYFRCDNDEHGNHASDERELRRFN